MLLPGSKVLITGGAGFIGSHLARRLLAEGHSVLIIDDLSTGSPENIRDLNASNRFSVIESKVSSLPNLAETVRECSFIYHLAAAVGVELVVRSAINTITTNLRETEVILEAAARNGTPLLFASTSEVYGKSGKDLFREEDDLLIGPPTLGRWSYACSKLMDEFLALAYANEKGLPVIIARFFNTVGPGQAGRYGMVLPRFISSALRGEPIRVHGSGSQTRCFCNVRDTIEALLRLARTEAARGQVVNIGSDEEVSIAQLAELVRREVNSQSKVEIIPYAQAYGPGFEDMLRRKPSVEKLERITGFRPRTSLAETIKETAAFLRGVPAPTKG